MTKRTDDSNCSGQMISPRLTREVKTVSKMIRLYCKAHKHTHSGELCRECAAVEAYAEARLSNCLYQAGKPTCANCTTHCYKPSMKRKIITIMRFSGPRMILKHPYLALFHLIDGKRYSAPEKKSAGTGSQRGKA